MEKKITSGIMLTALLIGMLTLVFSIHQVRASGTIHIRADGGVEPSTAPVHGDGDVYILTGNIADSVVIQRNNITFDGVGYTLQGIGAQGSQGISLSGISNVTIRNTRITEFDTGIFVIDSSNNTISRNTITNSDDGISVVRAGSNNSISGNTITNNEVGIVLTYCYFSCNISGNTIANNGESIRSIFSSGNSIYHNNFIGNTDQFGGYRSGRNTWDDGYPSGGNYWSDYSGADADHDGIGDTSYIINEIDQDLYPLMSPWGEIPVLPSPRFWPQWLFYAIVAAILLALGGAVYFLKRKAANTNCSSTSRRRHLGARSFLQQVDMKNRRGVFILAGEFTHKWSAAQLSIRNLSDPSFHRPLPPTVFLKENSTNRDLPLPLYSLLFTISQGICARTKTRFSCCSVLPQHRTIASGI